MTIKYHKDVEQGTPEWHELRRGIITASEVKHILTPKLKIANNDKSRQLVYKKAAEIISGVVDDTFVSYDMERGTMLEPFAVGEYEKHQAKTDACGFITNNRWGFKIGYSPDGLVGDDGLIEIKSPARKKHVEYLSGAILPEEHAVQVHTGLLVTGRKWADFISYYPGMDMCPVRVKPDATIHQSIVGAVAEFYAQVNEVVKDYQKAAKKGHVTEAVDINQDEEIVV